MFSEHIINELLGYEDVLSLSALTAVRSGIQLISIYYFTTSALAVYSKYKIPFLPQSAPMYLSKPPLAVTHFTTQSIVISSFPNLLLFSASVTLKRDVIPLSRTSSLTSPLSELLYVYSFNKIQLFCETFLINQ